MADASQKTTDSLAERLVGGDKRALARAISLVENRDERAYELTPSPRILRAIAKC